jgi:hypothetical protein
MWLSFLAGLVYLCAVAGLLNGMTGHSFLWMLAAVIAGAAFCSSLALFWLVRWALRDGRPGQFDIGSLCLFTCFASIYFAAVRWVVVNSQPSVFGQSVWAVSVFCLFLAVLSVPFLAGMANSLVWLAARLVRWPPLRRHLRLRHPPQGSDH